MMWRRWWLAYALVLLCGSVLMARQGVVRLHDGQALEGHVEERANEVSVTIRGIETVIPRQEIESIEYLPSPEERLRQRWADLDDGDATGRVTLARWAFENRQYHAARELLEEALEIDPGNRDAFTLLQTVRSQMRLERAQRANDVNRAPQPRPEVQPVDRPRRPQLRDDRHLLTADQINSIRQMELRDPVDANVRVRFENEVRRRYAEAHGIAYTDLTALRTIDQARLIIRDPRFRNDVRILSDPAAVTEFRRTVQPLVMTGCASSGCHGGPAGGDFVLYHPPEQEAVVYTNFYILQQFTMAVETEQTVFGSGERRYYMIDRTLPERSLLLQYALPHAAATMPHPEVPGYRGLFRGRDDARYLQFIAWMGRSLSPIEPDYGITYELPGAPQRERVAEQPTIEAPAAAEEPAEADQPEMQEQP